MEYLIGLLIAVAVFALGRFTGLDRDRAFYATITIVVAHYYCLFALVGGSLPALARELGPMAAFVVAAVVGFKRSPWIVAAALAGHGVFDIFHGGLIANPGVPAWWPGFCMTYDFAAPVGLAWIRWRERAAPRN
jgi:hypothetical protein